MVVGLGSGSTARYTTLRIAEKLAAGELRDIIAIPTSEATAELARQGGIPLTTLEEQPVIDLTIDGADEVDPRFNLIKGLGVRSSGKRSWLMRANARSSWWIAANWCKSLAAWRLCRWK